MYIKPIEIIISVYGWGRIKSAPSIKNLKNTFYTWISRLRKKTCYAIPEPSVSSVPDSRPAQEIVRVDILSEDPLRKPSTQEDSFLPVQAAQNASPSIEIAANGITFRFSGPVDASLYEKTLLMIGGRL